MCHLSYKWPPSVLRPCGENPWHYLLLIEDVAEDTHSGSSSGGMTAPQGSMPRFSPSDVKSWSRSLSNEHFNHLITSPVDWLNFPWISWNRYNLGDWTDLPGDCGAAEGFHYQQALWLTQCGTALLWSLISVCVCVAVFVWVFLCW